MKATHLSKTAERAKRLQIALTRMADGEYGGCSECGTAIPQKRLLAIPEATTCVACQAARASQVLIAAA